MGGGGGIRNVLMNFQGTNGWALLGLLALMVVAWIMVRTGRRAMYRGTPPSPWRGRSGGGEESNLEDMPPPPPGRGDVRAAEAFLREEAREEKRARRRRGLRDARD